MPSTESAGAKPPHGIFDLAASDTLGLTTALIYAALLGLFLLIGLGCYFYWRRRKRLAKALKRPALSPWESLQLVLKDVESKSSTPEAIGILNHSLRQGLELKLREPYTAYTSAEFLAHLQKNSQFSSDFQADCAEFLKTADKVLFAYQPCDEQERRRWETKVRQWLDSLQVGQSL